MFQHIERIADAIIAKKPKFAETRDEVLLDLRLFEATVDQNLVCINMAKSMLPKILSDQPFPVATLVRETNLCFNTWGISVDKLCRMYGVHPDDVYKLVAELVRRGEPSSVEEETIKLFVMATLRPQFDVMIA